MAKEYYMSERLHSGEIGKKTVAWLLKLGGLALAASGVVMGLKTKDVGVFAGLWAAGAVAGLAGEVVDESAIKQSKTNISYDQE